MKTLRTVVLRFNTQSILTQIGTIGVAEETVIDNSSGTVGNLFRYAKPKASFIFSLILSFALSPLNF